MALFPGLPRWAGTRKGKPISILLKHETVSGSGISWAISKSAPRSRQITTPVPHHSGFYRPDALPAVQPTASKHWRQLKVILWPNRKIRYFVNRAPAPIPNASIISCCTYKYKLQMQRCTLSTRTTHVYESAFLTDNRVIMIDVRNRGNTSWIVPLVFCQQQTRCV